MVVVVDELVVDDVEEVVDDGRDVVGRAVVTGVESPTDDSGTGVVVPGRVVGAIHASSDPDVASSSSDPHAAPSATVRAHAVTTRTIRRVRGRGAENTQRSVGVPRG